MKTSCWHWNLKIKKKRERQREISSAFLCLSLPNLWQITDTFLRMQMMTASEDSLFPRSQEVSGNQRIQGSPTEPFLVFIFFLFVHNKVKFNLTELLQNQCFGNDIAYGFIPTVYTWLLCQGFFSDFFHKHKTYQNMKFSINCAVNSVSRIQITALLLSLTL